ncbi:hypothetical protein [Pelagibius marinus]|uniref:hypothetical protein n=1 Tax=Pelagibius marinus TaxID=2762760 RepID=UPI00187267DF|nr:hypothetical protein [Pelagibius marinus]
MTLPSYAGYVIVPLHLLAGALFGLIPGSPYHSGFYATFGAIAVLLVTTLATYGWLVSALKPSYGAVWLQVLLAAVVVVALLFLVDFNDLWHAIIYLPIMGGSLLACLVTAHVILFAARPKP